MAEQSPFLEAVAISKSYGGQTSAGLKTTTLNIAQGKITAIIGESGSGKSTLLKMLYGLLSPDAGQIKFKGERVWGPEEKLIPGHDAMKMVTQDTDGLNLFAKVQDNISILLPNTNVADKEEKTRRVLQQLNITRIADKQAVYLSGGEKQRVAIARALVTQPEVLLLDEPFNQVDTSFREGLQQDIRQVVKETGLTVIMVSHDPAEVLSMADELIVIKDGEILETGSPKTLYQHPQNLYTARLLTNCNVLAREEAALCNIATNKEYVVIYPEWARPTGSWTHKDWTIKQVLFKGSHEGLVVEKGGVLLRLLNDQPDKLKEGDKVHVKVDRYLEF
ncbi:ABC transporter ATP-binding protein [Mucilaginibacter auburnensis]|uniref:ABC-type Fe3+/spermidine/putrescine transport system ATPase subunit n=1 Tax=Mucilaginibacter auburnensis TaxID=1457233 RepID=A0A2H9VSW5_9SPHI|nr:ABC transporter ATP-binding protein [Mucilaginibacter auburnensis]PJJ83917.1 ABC-type Fe3+/spermidine/putrescine transport system ATPase subunit [Mucilaginibacter auburnensis]